MPAVQYLEQRFSPGLHIKVTQGAVQNPTAQATTQLLQSLDGVDPGIGSV